MNGLPPLKTDIARPWWDGLARGEIMMQRCQNCAVWVFYPRDFCPGCGSRALLWQPVAPSATLYTYSIAQVPVAPTFAHLNRPVLALVDLANGVRLPTTLEGVEQQNLRIGMPLTAIFDPNTYPGVTLLRFGAAG